MKPHAIIALVATALLSFADEAKETPAAGFRTFTGMNGKTLEATVVARLDDETYTLATPEGKTLRMKISSLAASDQAYLMRWDPDFPVDLSSVKLEDAAAKMGYTAVKMEPSSAGTVIVAKLGDTDIKLYFDPARKNSIIDKDAAEKAGLKTSKSNTVFSDAAGNKTPAEECSETPLSLGGFAPKDLKVLVIDLAAIGGANIKNAADGIIGIDLLERMNALVDIKGQQMFVK